MFRRPRKMMAVLIKHPVSVFSMLLDIIQCSNKALPFYNLKYPSVFIQTVRLLLLRGFKPYEALQLGLLEPDFPKADLCKVVSEDEMAKIQKSFNPLSWKPLTDDKSIFYVYCKAVGLPVPELYAIFFRHNTGYALNGASLSSREDWCTFINRDLPSQFIIKPSEGAYGNGIKCFVRTDETIFIDLSSERQFRADDIYDLMLSDINYTTFVIQERLFNCADLAKLSNALGLQTLRIWTLVDKNNKCRILQANFKPIVGKNIISNHGHGSTNNLLAEIVLDKGTLKPAIKLTPHASGIQTVPFHPATGIQFDGFHIPLWDEVYRLAQDAALKFLPLRLIGWDIAVTPNGPYIIEANFFADPGSYFKNMDVMLSKLNDVTQNDTRSNN